MLTCAQHGKMTMLTDASDHGGPAFLAELLRRIEFAMPRRILLVADTSLAGIHILGMKLFPPKLRVDDVQGPVPY